eukprot:TRINITY_DN195_c0_g1_i2.p1 TRINITY_DN195_c0_g1~~TRINITY_DN195_c0_g1_i2.p1  ORF type:complete len:1670 (-),score=413.93 TRINITY_DN195_c0_g1_i2:224-5233(-)
MRIVVTLLLTIFVSLLFTSTLTSPVEEEEFLIDLKTVLLRADNTSTNATICTQNDGNCDECTANPLCGYCPTTALCSLGTAAGPSFPNVCPAVFGEVGWQYGQCSLTTPCGNYTDCFNCSSDPLCGWCSSLRRCSEGDASGPTIPSNCPSTDPNEWVSNPENCTSANTPAAGEYNQAIFSNFGNTIAIYFTQDTDRANLTGIFDCFLLVTPENYTSLGNAPECLWPSADSLVIRLGTNATIEPGQQLVLRQNLIAQKSNSSAFINETFGLVEPPYFPDTPVANIGTSHYITYAQPIILDGSTSYGSGSRPFIGGYLWALDNSTAGDARINTILFNNNGPIVVIPADLLTVGRTYVFRLTVVSFLQPYNFNADLADTTRAAVTVVDELRLPTRIAGPKIVNTHHINPISFQGYVGNPPSCVANSSIYYTYPPTGVVVDLADPSLCDQTADVSYAWVRSAGPLLTSVDNGTQSSSTLSLPGESLLGGSNYQITLVTTRDGLINGIGRDFVDIQVIQDPLVPFISGGNRIQSRSSPITLDASGSYDPNGLTGELGYIWQFERIDTSSTGSPTGTVQNDPVEILNNLYLNRVTGMIGSNITIPAFSLLPGTYSVRLVLTKRLSSGAFLPSQFTTTTLTLTWYDSPSVSLYVAPSEVSFNPTRPQSTSTIILQGNVAPSRSGADIVAYQYMLIDGDISMDDAGINWNGGSTLEIRPNTLTPGANYVFRLLAWDSNYDSGLSYPGVANITLYVNAAPNGGYCSVEPSSGVATFTRFNVSCRDWEDDKFDFPLTKRFFADTGNGVIFPLNSGYVVDNTILTLLPNSPTGSVEIFYQVLDRWGATIPYYLSAGIVSVTPPPSSGNPLQDAQDQINNYLEPVLRSGDTTTVAQTIYSILANLNAGNSESNTTNPFLASQEESIRQQLLIAARDRLALGNSQSAGNQLLNIIWQLTGGEDRSRIARRIAFGRIISKRYCPEVINSTDANPALPIELGLAYFLRNVVVSGRATSYENVQLALNAASNLINFAQPLITNNTEVGYQFAAQVVSTINELMLQQENVLTPGVGAVNWTSPYIALSVRRDVPCTIQQSYEFQGGDANGNGAVGRNVRIQLPSNIASLITTPTIVTGIIVYYNNPFNFPSAAQNGYFYNSSFPRNQPYFVNETFGQLNYPDAGVQSNIGNASDNIVSAAVVTVALFYNRTAVEFPVLTSPLVISFPNNLQGSDGVSFEDQVDLFGVQCQRWYWTGQNDSTFDPYNSNITTSGWVVPNCTWSIDRFTQYSTCSCYELLSTYAAAAAPLAVIPGTVGGTLLPLGDIFESSSRNWNWYFLPITVFILALALCALAVAAYYARSQPETSEVETRIQSLITTTTQETGPGRLIDSPRPREIRVPTGDPLRSIELRRPEVREGVVVYMGEDGREYDSPASSVRSESPRTVTESRKSYDESTAQEESEDEESPRLVKKTAAVVAPARSRTASAASRDGSARSAAERSAEEETEEEKTVDEETEEERSADERSAEPRSAGARSAGERSAEPVTASEGSAEEASAGERSAEPVTASEGSVGERSAEARSVDEGSDEKDEESEEVSEAESPPARGAAPAGRVSEGSEEEEQQSEEESEEASPRGRAPAAGDSEGSDEEEQESEEETEEEESPRGRGGRGGRGGGGQHGDFVSAGD